MNSEIPKRVAIYPRIATSQEQERNFALTSQIEQCKAYCQEHGYTLDDKHIYSEVYDGRSDYHNRPQLTALIEAAKQQEFDIVVIVALDRLSRDQAQTTAIISELVQQNITIECIDGCNLNDAAWKFIQQIATELMQMERQKVIKRIQHRKAAKKAQQ